MAWQGQSLVCWRLSPQVKHDVGAEHHGQEEYLIYSALGLQTIKRMVEGGKVKVVLIARDRRMGREIDKSKAILAATRGGFFNELVTDVATAAKLQRLAGRSGRGEPNA